MTTENIDWDTVTPEDANKIEAKLQAVRERFASAHKDAFLQQVIKASIENGIRWSEASALISSYQPKNDKEAKKLGYKYKGKDKESKDVYYVRKLKGAEPLT
jgi:ribosomal protein L34